jgi:mannose-6-phosphate isomerase-like protein (cupin superfamily)
VTRYVFSTTDTARYRFPTHVNDLIMDRSEAEVSEVFIVVLQPGEAPPLHLHSDCEQIFYLLEGTGVLQVGEAAHDHPVRAGDLVRIPPNTLHRIVCTGSGPLRYLSVDAFIDSGGPRGEPTWDSHVRAMCKEYGWDFDQVRIKR